MAEELKILQKIFDMIEYGYLALAQYPKSEKFGLVTDIKHIMDSMLERCIEAEKKYYKKTTSYAYKLIRKLNKELQSTGCITIPGRIDRKFFHEKFYSTKTIERSD